LEKTQKAQLFQKVFLQAEVRTATAVLVKITKKAENARNFSQCDSLLLGDKCGAHTFPYLEINNSTAKVEHEATTSKIGEDQIFYLESKRNSTEDAIGLIVNGYCKEVLAELPMEFAVEAQKLLSISLEGSVDRGLTQNLSKGEGLNSHGF
jgi:Fe-S cluster assembly protein SufB